MKERRLFLFLTFLPIGMAIFFWDLDSSPIALANSATSPAPSEQLNAQLRTTILEQTRLTQYDPSGLQSQQITSNRLSSNNFQKVVDIDQPIITLETDDGIWVAESIKGEFDQVKNRLSLLGTVTLTQTSKNRSTVQMQTEQLDYYPGIRLAETDTPVTIKSSGHHLESIGIRIDLAQSVFTLPKRVRSTHAPM